MYVLSYDLKIFVCVLNTTITITIGSDINLSVATNHDYIIYVYQKKLL